MALDLQSEELAEALTERVHREFELDFRIHIERGLIAQRCREMMRELNEKGAVLSDVGRIAHGIVSRIFNELEQIPPEKVSGITNLQMAVEEKSSLGIPALRYWIKIANAAQSSVYRVLAEELLRRDLDDRGRHKILTGLGFYFARTGEDDRAIATFRAALALGTKNSDIRYLKIQIERLENRKTMPNLEEALKNLRDLSISTLIYWSKRAKEEGDTKGRILILEEIVRKSEKDPDAKAYATLLLSHLYEENGDMEMAVSWAEKLYEFAFETKANWWAEKARSRLERLRNL